MRVFIFISGYGLLLIMVFFIGLLSPKPKPEDFHSPIDAQEFIDRGRLYEERGEYEAALADYLSAEQLQPRDQYGIYYRIYQRQAMALVALNRIPEAIQVYQKIRQMEQDDNFSTEDTDRRIAELQAKLKPSEK